MKIQIEELQELKNKDFANWDCQLICSLLFEAAKIAKPLYKKFEWKKKSDNSLLTEADLKIERLFAGFFDKPEDGVYLIGEESVAQKNFKYLSNAMKETCWILDPIDGTAPFACNIPTWGISLGFAKAGRLIEGAIFLPACGELYITNKGKNFFAEDINLDTRTFTLKRLKSPDAKFAKGGLVSISQDIAKKGRIKIENPVQAVCCSVFSAAGVLRGRYSGFVGTMRLWDIAGAIPLLLNGGFSVKMLNGVKISSKINRGYFKELDLLKPDAWRFKTSLIISKTKKTICEIRKAIS